jgi:hypothetical protein
MVSTVLWSRIGRAGQTALWFPCFPSTVFIGRMYDPLFVLQTEQYVEPAPDTIARVARIY